MAQSNRHWPSMFKSKPCTAHHQWQHEINPSLIANSCSKAPYSSVVEERSPEPKPRWNPKPEQIRILEAIFNSGMVNPPRDEIRRIRAQLQEYGQVGDANVFYWFQNRKSRSKHKNRHLQSFKSGALSQSTPPPTTAAPSSSSSSSEKSSSGADKALALGGANVVDVSNSPTASVNQTYFTTPTQGHFSPEPLLFQVQQVAAGPTFSHGYYLSSDFSTMTPVPEGGMGHCTSLLHELMSQELSKKEIEAEKMKMVHHQHGYLTTTTTTTGTNPSAIDAASAMNEIQGTTGAVVPARSTVFINDVAFEVGMGPLNVREAFGDDAVLLHASGQPVLTNEWGITLHALQHGASYYLV
ncbi:WUSCHEL-related homeobox 9-like [Aristolochia californica]|uniref:WUSCHEL-related homeobox 9-like n=1 Tax=Aristolochia californica TaxID=171875 RepID=UPI0035DE4C0D